MSADEFTEAWSRFVERWLHARAKGGAAAERLVQDLLDHGLEAVLGEDFPDGPSRRPTPAQLRRCEMEVVRASGLFDRDAYLRANAAARKRGANPVEHFCTVGWRGLHNPSKDFDAWWYWSEYLDPGSDTVNPLLHYVAFGRPAGYAAVPPVEPRRPSVSYDSGQGPRRVCLFAGYDPDGLIDDYVVDYLAELGRHADVFYLADGYIEPAELLKLQAVTKGAWAIAHGAYDFGSYSVLARDLVGWDVIDGYDEVVLANDSGFLLRPLDEVFTEMDGRACDWWGLQMTRHDFTRSSNDGKPLPIAEAKAQMIGQRFMSELDHLHISSYFLVYRRPVFTDPGFRRRLDSVAAQPEKVLVIYKYEIGIGRYLMCRGFDFSTFIEDLYPFHPLYTEHYFELLTLGFPLLKRNFLSENSRSVPDLVKWRERIRALVPGAPLDIIEANLLRVSHDDKLRRSFGLVTDEWGDVADRRPHTWRQIVDEDRVSPTYDHWWAFPVDVGHHRLSGNQRALFEAVRDDPTIKKVVLTRSRGLQLEGENVVVVPLQSGEGQHHALRSGNFFLEQTPRVAVPYPLSPRRHRFVHVGGGARLHRPAALTAVKDDHPGQDAARCTAAVASSTIDALATAVTLSPLSVDAVWAVGALRNDLLLRPADEMPEDLRAQEEGLRALLEGRPLVLFSPASAVEHAASPGEGFSEEAIKRLSAWAEAAGVVLGFQDHQGDRSRRLSQLLLPLGALHLPAWRYPHLEVVHRVADAVVTDFAQSAIDFTVSGKRVVSLIETVPGAGPPSLLHDLDVVLAGEICTDLDTFQQALDRLFDDPGPERRAAWVRARSLMFDRRDDRNAERLVRRMKQLYVG